MLFLGVKIGYFREAQPSSRWFKGFSRGDYGRECDIYSLGATMLSVITGQQFSKHLEATKRSLRGVSKLPNSNEKIESQIQRMLIIEPKKRIKILQLYHEVNES